MSTVQEIEQAIAKLPEAEFISLMDRLRARHADVWDRQIENDVASGRLDFLVREAEAEQLQGKTKPLNEVIDDR